MGRLSDFPHYGHGEHQQGFLNPASLVAEGGRGPKRQEQGLPEGTPQQIERGSMKMITIDSHLNIFSKRD